MTTRNAESSQPPEQGEVEDPSSPSPPGLGDSQQCESGNMVFKSGPLFISSKGIGWTSWKKRWFILTRTSLVFFRNDPNAVPQKGGEVNLILGGIDLNNSGSVDVKADKKLLTVLFPDGRDGRAFTLKAETLEDLYEWKTALEKALPLAPSAIAMDQNGILKNEQADETEASSEQSRDKQPIKTSIIGRPVLLALEDVDGSPSFLEKALRFIEEHGVKVEGILRQAADVEDVECRIRDYEQGITEFSADEDAHVIGDCIKYILREMPSSPVPASCCKALVEASRADRAVRVNAIREAICETFPEPNRRLLQRILMMMQRIASNKEKNRMSSSAVAACMAPLLLRPLLAGDCDIEHDFNVGDDGSIQLLQAAAAANHAQAIVITLLEEYDNIFKEGTMSPGIYSDTEDSGLGSEDATDDDYSYEDDGTEGSDAYTEDDGTEGSDANTEDDGTEGSEANTEDDDEYASDGSPEESGSVNDNTCAEKGFESFSSASKSSKEDDSKTSSIHILPSTQSSLSPHDKLGCTVSVVESGESSTKTQASESAEKIGEDSVTIGGHGLPKGLQKSSTYSNGPGHAVRRPTVLGRTSARKNLSMESIDYPLEDDDEIQKLECSKIELQNRIAEEVKGNANLQASLERRKKELRENRLALENEVERLQEQLQKHKEWRMNVEAGLMSLDPPIPESIDEKTKADLMEIAEAERDVANLKQKASDHEEQLQQQQEPSSGSMYLFNQSEKTSDNQEKQKEERNIERAEDFNFKRSARSKERRSQIANELHNMEKGRSSSQDSGKMKASESQKIPRDLDSGQAPETSHGESLESSGKKKMKQKENCRNFQRK